MYRTGLWTLWERERVGRFGRMALKKKRVHIAVLPCFHSKTKEEDLSSSHLNQELRKSPFSFY